ncbi:hypothetical protein Syun_026083 [Stephania yunnanensis]|uniref:Uncharacterized protein n=1 Tax=Stephania yunnanensis TaxID=152371 RepID=A0AAP0EZY3_9MAGN
MSFAIYDAWCQKAVIRYTGNIYLIAKKRITLIYLTYEMFEHYKRKRATDEAFKKKSEQMSTNRKSDVGRPGTGISLHSAGSITAKLTQRLEEMSTQSPDTSIDEDAIYLEVMPEVKGRVYGLGSQGYHRSISSVTERSGPQSDDKPRHLTTDIAPSQSVHMDDHQPGHWTDPHKEMSEDRHHLLDDHDKFMSQFMRLRDHHHAIVYAAVAFDIGVAYREGVDKASLFLLGFGWDTLC